MNRPIEAIEKVAIVFLVSATLALLSITGLCLYDAYTSYSNSDAITIYKEQECLK